MRVVATREELKAQIEEIAVAHGHRLGPWLDVGHASQVGCLNCDRYAFAELLPPPGRLHAESFEQDCPKGVPLLTEIED